MIDKILIALIILLFLTLLFTPPDRGQIRVYEWKTKSNDTCVMAFSTNGGVGLDCL